MGIMVVKNITSVTFQLVTVGWYVKERNMIPYEKVTAGLELEW